jgi:hydroxymethylglutaryl-CoA lyase
MQGIKTFIPTHEKIVYLQSLLNCGFDTLDFGSFVSPKAIPQMADTAAVLKGLDLSNTETKLLSIVANIRGAQEACRHPEITYLGYPFSISENFQMRNTHATITEAIGVLKDILVLAQQHNKKLVVYLSMGFGNPYGDPWSIEIVSQWVDKLASMGVTILSLSDTVGSSQPSDIRALYHQLIPKYPQIEFGAHFHTKPQEWFEKVNAAFEAGCQRFDGAIQGFGGCPMAADALTGNMPTEKLLSYFSSKKVAHHVRWMAFEAAHNKATALFQSYH